MSRLLRAHRIETAALYASRSAQHAQQLQLHLIRVLCSMNMKSEAVRHTEVWGLQNDSEIQRVLRVNLFGARLTYHSPDHIIAGMQFVCNNRPGKSDRKLPSVARECESRYCL